MNQVFRKKPYPHHLLAMAEIKKLCGPPPVLSTESVEAYDKMLFRLVESLEPRDALEQLFAKHLADCTWEIIRYTRHKTLLMERKHRQLLDHKVRNMKAQAQDKRAQVRKPGEEKQDCESPSDPMQATLQEIEAMMLQAPTEFDHADALERGIEYAERLDKLLNAATARRDDILAQWDRYRELGFGGRRFIGFKEITDYETNGTDFFGMPEKPEVEPPPGSDGKQVEPPLDSSGTS